MQIDNYISEDIEKILINHYYNYCIIKNIDDIWSYRGMCVLKLYLRIIKFMLIVEEDNNLEEIKKIKQLNIVLSYFKKLKNENLLSVEEIRMFHNTLENVPGFEIKEWLENKDYNIEFCSSENFGYCCMSVINFIKTDQTIKELIILSENFKNF